MVNKPVIGVLGIQGAISEHVHMMQQVLGKKGFDPVVLIVRKKEDLNNIDGLIIPGGESTTISRFLLRNHLHSLIQQRVQEQSLFVMGTCAGCVLVASNMVNQVKDIELLSLMDMKVERNAFGRQKESFEALLNIKGFNEAFPAVFIRAPVIVETGGTCQPLAWFNGQIVMAQQDNVIGLSFHPELTDHLQIHEYFINCIISDK